MRSDGTFIITKPDNTGGEVSLETVKEQLLYEIGDPDNYLSPDVTVSFLSLDLKEISKDRIDVSGARGRPHPSTYKVSATYRHGYKTEALLTIFGQEAYKKAQLCGEILLEHVKESGYELQRSLIECLGTGAVIPGVWAPAVNPLECVLRVAVADERLEALEAFSKEVASLVTSGPQGVTGYTSGRPHIRPVYGFWPSLIERERVPSSVSIMEAP